MTRGTPSSSPKRSPAWSSAGARSPRTTGAPATTAPWRTPAEGALTYRETYLQIYRMHWGHGHGRGPGQRHGLPHGRGDPWAEMFSEWWRGPAPRCERGLVRW